MRITRIQLHNFGPFHGDHELVFNRDGSGVHLIRGGNGQGKTSLQRSVLWCLYGKVSDRKGKEIPPTSLLNWAARDDDIYQYWVRLYFVHNGSSWIVTRKSEATTHSDKKYRDGMKVHVIKDDEPLPNEEQEIRRLLPREVSRFFFFDGEMLRDYEALLDQTSPAMKLLRNSIERVLGIPYLRIAREDLYRVQKQLERERNRLLRRMGGKDLDELAEMFQEVSDEVDRREQAIDELDRQIEDLDTEISDLKRQAAEVESIEKLAKQRLEIEAQIESLQRERSSILEKQTRLASQLYKTVLSAPAGRVISRLEERHKAAMEKYDKKQECLARAKELERAISGNKCDLCGTVLDEAKVATLEPRLQEVRIQIEELTEIPEPNLEFDNHVNRLRAMVHSSPEREAFQGLQTDLNAVDHQIAAAEASLSEVNEQLKDVDADEPRRLAVQIEKYTNERGRLSGIKEGEQERLSEALDLKAEINQRLSSIDQEEVEILAKRIDLVKSLADIMGESVDVYIEEKRESVESAATSIFQEIRSKQDFNRLEINEQFGLNILTASGQVLDRAEWRSAGEEQIVALALVGALSRSARAEAPIFMDTPFGRLDISHGERVLTFLPKLADQIVLLVTDREFRKGDERYLKGEIRTDLTVIHRGEQEGSVIMDTRNVEV